MAAEHMGRTRRIGRLGLLIVVVVALGALTCVTTPRPAPVDSAALPSTTMRGAVDWSVVGAAAFDDLFGFLLYRVGELAVTRSLTVEYLRPVLLGLDYGFTAYVRDRTGRRLHVDAAATDEDGRQVATAHATFVTVDVEHFEQGSSAKR